MRKAIFLLGVGTLLSCGPHQVGEPTGALGARLATSSGISVGVAFGNVSVGSSAKLPIGIQSVGGSNLVISQASATGAGMSVIGPTFPLTLAPGAAADIQVQFAPTSNGAVSGELTLTSNATGSPTIIPLTGTGVGASTSYTLRLSASSSRAPASALDGSTVKGSIYVFTSDAAADVNPSGIQQVSYWLDDTAMSGTPTHVEKATPYDFAGTAGDGSAQPYDTTGLADGKHTLTQAVLTAAGSTQSATATFTVSNGSGNPPPDAGTQGGCPATAVDLSEFGSAGNGGDDTAVLQSAINQTAGAGQVLKIGKGASSYSVKPLSLPSNAHVCFESGVTVEAAPGYGPFDVMWSINGVSNAELLGYGATFHMNTSEWSSDPDPEYRHCVAIIGSSNVHAAGFSCVTFGGDGIYLAGNSANALVEDVTSDGHARDGLTVISAKNSIIRRCHFNNGHVAVDMEPNGPTDAMDGVTLEDSDSSDNHYGGVNVSTYAYNASTPPMNVVVARHTDKNTAIGATDFHAGTCFSANGANGVAFSGSLLYDSCTCINAGSRGAWVAWWTANGANVTYKNLTIINPNQNGTAVDGAAVAVGRGGGGVGDQGNASFLGTNVSDTQGKIAYYFTFYDGSGQGFSKVKFDTTGTLSGATKAPPNGLLNGAGVASVNQ